MKRRYKLLLIILIGAIITFFININTKKDELNLVALGDSFCLGYIDNKTQGISFNDYLKERLIVDNYNNEFCKRNLTIDNLLNMLDKNTLGIKSNIPIQQVINNADILTLAIGIDEINYYAMYSNVNKDSFIDNYNKLIKYIRSFYNNRITIISLYPFNGIDKNTILDINNGIKRIAMDNNAEYIDIFAYALNKDYFYNNKTIYLNYRAHKNIAKTINNS